MGREKFIIAMELIIQRHDDIIHHIPGFRNREYQSGQYLLLKANMCETFLLGNIYAPNDSTSQKTFVSNFNNIVQQYADLQIVIQGVLNCSLIPQDNRWIICLKEKNCH